MWSQGSSAVLKSCSGNLFQFFLNFQVLFQSCYWYFLQVVWSCDLRVQMLCLSHVSVIYFNLFLNFQVLFKSCSCSFCQVHWSNDLRVQKLCSRHVPVIYFNSFSIFKSCSSHVLAIFPKCSGHVISGFKWCVKSCSCNLFQNFLNF